MVLVDLPLDGQANIKAAMEMCSSLLTIESMDSMAQRCYAQDAPCAAFLGLALCRWRVISALRSLVLLPKLLQAHWIQTGFLHAIHDGTQVRGLTIIKVAADSSFPISFQWLCS